MKKGVTKMGNRISAWLLTLVMIVGLVAVPAGEVKAASDDIILTINNPSGSVALNGTTNVDVEINSPSGYSTIEQLLDAGYTKLQVDYEVTQYDQASTGTAGIQLYFAWGATWTYNTGGWTNLSDGKTGTLEWDFSSAGNKTDELKRFGVQIANVTGTVTYKVSEAKLIGGGSTGGSGSESSGGATSDEVTAKVEKKSGDANWAEYNYSVTNGTDSAISGIQIKVPASGSVNNLQSWNCSASYSGGYIIISHSAVLPAGETYSCIGSEDIKFGFAGGASLGTPIVEFVYGEDGGGTSSSALNYELTGKTKDVAFADTPVGKHGKLSLKEVDGYKTPVIVDEYGKPFQLRGASTHGIQWNEMRPYVNEGSFQSLRDEWGVNMVRLACYVTQGGYTAGSKDSMDSTIQTGVEAAKKLGMYVIVDWHIHEENPHTTKSQAEEFFRTYATKYKNYDNVIFEICNEPTGVSWYTDGSNDLYAYCKDIAKIIRDCGSNALIVCGTNTWSQDVDDVAKKPLKDDGFENILYTFHFYSGSHYEDKMNKVRTALAAGTPIFVTEFGICDASGNGGFDTANADKWIELCDANNISYACWSLCNKNESASYLKPSSTKTTGGWTEDDLATTGIWLVNTYRAHQDKEEGTDTSNGEFSLSIEPESGQLDDVGEGYTNPGKFIITVTNTGGKELSDWSVKMGRGTNTPFTITKDLDANTTLAAGKDTTIEVSLSSGKKAGTYSDSVIVQSGTQKKTVTIKQTVIEKAVPVTGVTVSPTELSLKKGETAALTTTVSPEDATNKNVTWSSKDTKVATVSASGVVTAVASGTTTITVTTTDGGKTAECKVTVTNPLTDFELQEKLALTVGETHKLTITPTPKDADSYEVEWSSKDAGVASVGTDGTVKAVGKGTTTITAKVGNITKTCTVTVTVPLERIIIKPDTLNLNKGESSTLTASPYPEGAELDSSKITWSSDAPGTATVDENGTVTAVKSGTAKITASVGDITSNTCVVTVKTPVTGIEIPEVYQTLELDLKVNTTYDLSKVIQISPTDADNKAVTWESSDSTKVSVSDSGLVTALKTTIIDAESETDAPVTITVTTQDGEFKAECLVSVVGVPVTDITIVKNALSVDVLETVDLVEELQPTVIPSDATKKTITWISSDKNIATVTADGKLTAHRGGEVDITVKAGNITKTCKVTVVKKKQELKSINVYKVSRTYNSITIGYDQLDATGTGDLEFSADGETWVKPVGSKAVLSGLTEFTPYKVKVRLAATDDGIYDVSNIWEASNPIYTLVKDPHNVDVSKLGDSDYLDALREADDKDPTVSFEDGKLTLSETKPAEYTITGENEDLTIVTGDGDYDITLQDTTIKKVDVSDSDNVDLHIKGNVTVKEGIVSNKAAKDKDTDININGDGKDESTLDTPSVRTEGSLTIDDVTVNADASKSESGSEGPALSGKDVTITDSTVDATGGDGSPAIEAEEEVTITDSEVHAKGGSDAPAVKGDKVVMENSKVDLETKNGQKGVQANDIVVDNTDVSFNGSKDADLDDIYSVTPKDKNGNDITGNNPNPNPNPTPDPGPGLDTGGNGAGNNGTDQTGNAKVQATSLKLTASVKGANNIPVGSSIKLAPKKKITLKVAGFLPEGAESEGVTFTSSKPTVAKVDSSGKITAGKKAGKTTITVTTASGGASKTITVQVMKKAVSKVTLKASKTTIKVKKTVKLKATLTPNKKNASNNVFWKSSNTKVATVSASGVVKGVKKGKAKITATATDGSGKKATVTIQVK